ncbi:MAG: hypothetical protein F6K21_06395 [Symploca sp. SIO2D2]|nr:hypothetical protein [Symploca sp. SIO2D2]
MSWKLDWKPPMANGKLKIDSTMGQYSWSASYAKLVLPTAQYSWSAPYAAQVHEGATLRSGRILPARPWTTVATEEFDHPRQFIFHYQKLGSLAKAFKATAMEFGGVMQDAITSPIWEWDRITVRSTGEIADSPRNIVDTGKLRDSYEVRFIAKIGGGFTD